VGAERVNPESLTDDPPPPLAVQAVTAPLGIDEDGGGNGSRSRYRPLPTGAHGLAREEVERDQRERLTLAMIDLIARHGYEAVRILDLTQLARVSRPTFYELYADKEALLLGTYDGIAERIAEVVIEAYDADGPLRGRLQLAIRVFAELAAAEPEAMSLFLFGALGAGPKALEGRNRALEAFEASLESGRDGAVPQHPGDLTVKLIIGGIREVAAARLRHHREHELTELSGELAAWAARYPPQLPASLLRALPPRLAPPEQTPDAGSQRARPVRGRLPSGRHDLPRAFVVKTQRERIVDATAAIVAEKGLAGLTVSEIATRAKVSHATFYAMYSTKRDAFLGAQKVGMHQAFRIAVEAYEAHRQEDWSRAVAAGLRALIAYLHSEPAHAHLSIVDTFAASPETLKVRDETLGAFAAYLGPGERPAGADRDVPAIAPEAVVGGIWQILHHYIANDRLTELVDNTEQLIFLTLVPFLGAEEAARAALHPS
jgi:AcrR family transcriptional regulator